VTDLIETILAAAAAAIRNQTPAITSDAGRVAAAKRSAWLKGELTR